MDKWESRTRPGGLRYLIGASVPREVPEGRVLAHNHIRHTTRTGNGVRGFRCWTWPAGKQPDHFAPCRCGWAGLPHYARAW